MAKRRGPSPTVLVGVSVVVGLSIGLAVAQLGQSDADITTVLALPGRIWLKCLKCIVLPMIVFSMVEAMVMMRSLPGARSVGIAVVGLYTCTTVMAALEGCAVSAMILAPYVTQVNITAASVEAVKAPVQRSALETILGIFDNLVPANLVNDAARNNLLPVIVASVAFGLLVQDRREDGSKSYTMALIGEWNAVVVKVVTGIMVLTPMGVGSLVFASAARLDLETMGRNVAFLVLTVATGLLIHLAIVYPSMLLLLARRNPATYLRNIIPALATALGTSSSAATLPVSLSCAVDKNGIKPHIANFVLSLGATINMDGTSIYLICACFFLGTLQGISFGLGDFITMALLATFCSMGSAPVPSASLVLLATIMAAVGVPFNETFGVISAVDWMLDRLRTSVNVAGDAIVTGIVDGFVGEDAAAEDGAGVRQEHQKGQESKRDFV